MIFRLPKDTVMNKDLLFDLIQKHKEYVRKDSKPLQDAYENKYEIFYAPAKPAYKPDNRIAVNYAKYITDTFNGFFIGIPVKVTSQDETVQAYIDTLNDLNDVDNNNAEISKLTDISGCSFEMYYNKEDGETGITYLSDLEAFMVTDDSILERPMYFVRYYEDANGVEHGSFSDSEVVQHFYLKNGVYYWDQEPHYHGFGYVPAVEYVANTERMGLFESAMPAINAYNKALSEKANDIDYFADAYLKILGAHLDDEDTIHIRSSRVINFDGDTDKLPEVAFMEKPSDDASQEHLLDRLKTDIFLTSMVANISDENFAGQSSGVALRYKLEAMSNLFTSKVRRFTSSMRDRYKIIFSSPVAQQHGVSKDAWAGIDIKFTANYPANLENEAEVAKNLEGIVSKETQLKVLSIVDNMADELDRLEQEQLPSVVDNVYGNTTTEAIQ